MGERFENDLRSMNNSFGRGPGRLTRQSQQHFSLLTRSPGAEEEGQIKCGDHVVAGGDLKAVCHLIGSIAKTTMGDHEGAARELAGAKQHWPDEFEAGGDFIVTAEKALLWFNPRAELEALRAEAEQLLASAQP